MSTIDFQYEFTLKEYENLSEQFENDIERSIYPNSYRALFRNSEKIDSLLEGIVSSKHLYYNSQILTRCLFEHLLVGYYIYIRILTEKSDIVGEEYYKNYFVSEFFKQQNYHLRVENIKDNKSTKTDLSKIKEKFPEFIDLTQPDLDDAYRIGNQFDIRSIGDYLNNKLDHSITSSDTQKNLHVSMLGFLNRYNELSSYIHGGPFAEMHTFDNENIDKEEICKGNIAWAKIASRYIKENIIIVFSVEFNGLYKQAFEEIVTSR